MAAVDYSRNSSDLRKTRNGMRDDNAGEANLAFDSTQHMGEVSGSEAGSVKKASWIESESSTESPRPVSIWCKILKYQERLLCLG